MCSFNPYLTTSEMHAEILQRHYEETIGQHEDECYSYEVISLPNGQSYGIAGHVPCDHTAIFYYPDHCAKVSQFGKNGWTHHPL